MVLVKNYETVPTFVKVMQKKSAASFFRTRCGVFDNDNDDSLRENAERNTERE